MCWACGLALDLEDYHPSVLLHCWLGHLTCKIVCEMTYNASSGKLNPTVTYRTHITLWRMWQFVVTEPFTCCHRALYMPRGGHALQFICWFWRYINCLFVYLPFFLTYFLLYTYTFFLTCLLPDLPTLSTIDCCVSRLEVVGGHSSFGFILCHNIFCYGCMFAFVVFDLIF